MNEAYVRKREDDDFNKQTSTRLHLNSLAAL